MDRPVLGVSGGALAESSGLVRRKRHGGVGGEVGGESGRGSLSKALTLSGSSPSLRILATIHEDRELCDRQLLGEKAGPVRRVPSSKRSGFPLKLQGGEVVFFPEEETQTVVAEMGGGGLYSFSKRSAGGEMSSLKSGGNSNGSSGNSTDVLLGFLKAILSTNEKDSGLSTSSLMTLHHSLQGRNGTTSSGGGTDTSSGSSNAPLRPPGVLASSRTATFLWNSYHRNFSSKEPSSSSHKSAAPARRIGDLVCTATSSAATMISRASYGGLAAIWFSILRTSRHPSIRAGSLVILFVVWLCWMRPDCNTTTTRHFEEESEEGNIVAAVEQNSDLASDG